MPVFAFYIHYKAPKGNFYMESYLIKVKTNINYTF